MFERLLEAVGLGLERLGIAYMVIGGQALLLHGEPRLTRDIDVTLGVGPERLTDLLEWIHEQGWRVLVENPAEFVQRTMVVPCIDPASGIRLDFVLSFSAYEQQALARARRIPLGTAEVRFASVEDLIIHKLVAGRPRDLEDARSVLLKNPSFDIAYVRGWLGEFDRSLGGELRQRFEELRRSRPGV